MTSANDGNDGDTCSNNGTSPPSSPSSPRSSRPVIVNNFYKYGKIRGWTKATPEDTASVDTASVDTASVNTASVNTASVNTASVGTVSPNNSPSWSSSCFTMEEKSQIENSFYELLKSKMSRLYDSSDAMAKAWSNRQSSLFASPDKDDHFRDAFRAEREMIHSHLNPFLWGAGSMMITLVSMRTGRWHQLRRSPATTRLSSEINPIIDPSTMPVDLALSLLFGSCVSIFLFTAPQQQEMRLRDFARAPLLPGRSLLSETLCVDFEAAFNHLHVNNKNENHGAEMSPNNTQIQTLWHDQNIQSHPSLIAVRDFVSNCQRRAKVENQIRRTFSHDISNGNDSEVQELGPVLIPSPGISPDFPLDDIDKICDKHDEVNNE